MQKTYFIAGIGTGVGKTLVSALLTEAMRADYWKPVQTGSVEGTDSETVRALVSNNETVIHPESYLLRAPESPHAAAARENVSIRLDHIRKPQTGRDLIIEGAGGLLVPLNEQGVMIIDLIDLLCVPVILVSRNYLGSINHTLLSLEALRRREIPVRGVIISGERNPDTERIIEKAGNAEILLRVGQLEAVTRETIHKLASEISI